MNEQYTPEEDRAIQDSFANPQRLATKDTNPKDAIGGNKPSYSAVPVPVLYELGAALSEGARKYGGYNWRVAGVRASVYINATRRHLDSWWEGEDIDPDSGLSHITKAIASLTVLRDAMIQGMLANDDRPPRAAEFLPAMQQRMDELAERYPRPRPPFTEREVAHIRNTPVSIGAGQVLGYDVEVMLPAPDAPDGFVWMQQGSRRLDLDLALTVAQALREDGYGERVVRIMEAAHRVEVMADQTEYVSGELRRPVATVFPGDPSLTALTEEEAEELASEEAEESDMTDEAIRQEIADQGGGFDEYGNRVEPTEEAVERFECFECGCSAMWDTAVLYDGEAYCSNSCADEQAERAASERD